MKQTSNTAIILAAALVLSACATQTTRDFKSADKLETWRVRLPLQQVYRDYKEYSVDKYDKGNEGFLLRGGLNVYSEYFGEEEGAELTVKASTTLYTSPLLHFEFEHVDDATLVKAWYFSSSWKKVLNDYKALHEGQLVGN